MDPKTRVALKFVQEVISSKSEQEVERLLRAMLPDSPFKGLVKAVGGYVRDQYLSLLKNDPSIEAKDLDLVVDMKNGAEKVTRYIFDQFKDLNPIPISEPRQMGKGYPIWQITFKGDITFKGELYHTTGAVIEFADTMKEEYPDPESRQRVTMPANIKEDVARRDFTVNMLLKDMTTGEIEDLTGQSKEDIKNGILRGHPDVPLDKTFEDDPLRMIRLIRFQAKYDWDIPLAVLRAVKRKAERIIIVSSERIMGELKKIMDLGKLRQAIKLMSATGLLKHVLPEVEALKGVKQCPKWHGEGDAYRHTLMVLEEAPPGVENQIAALLHDIGKPATTMLIEDEIKSKGHEDVGAEIAEAILKRLKFDNDTTERVKRMVRNHMRPHHLGRPGGGGTKALRKFVREVGDELVDSILDLARADELGKVPPTNEIPDLRKRIDEIRKQVVDTKKEPLLNGKEIMDLLGIPTGTEVGRAKKILIELEDDYAEKGKTLTKDEARQELLKEFHKKRASAYDFKTPLTYPGHSL
jgi:poly(A) polymerase